MKTRIIHRVLYLTTAILSYYIIATSAYAQSGSSAGWTQLGALPPNAYDVAIDGNSPANLYALGSKGLSRSTDMGKNWIVCDPEARSLKVIPPPVAGMGAPTTLYTTGALGPRSSTDSCANWKVVPTQGILPAGANVRMITAHPLEPRTLFAAMNGLGGLYVSTNGGDSWQSASELLPFGAWITAVTVDPGDREHIFIGVRYTTRNHPSAYVFESTDTGLTWHSASLGLHVLPNNSAQITGFAWSIGTLFASTWSDGLYVYSEETKSWSQTGLPSTPQGAALTPTPNAGGILPLPINIRSLHSDAMGVLSINTPRGLYRSSDRATSWERVMPNGANNGGVVAIDPTTGRVLLMAGGRIWGYNVAARTTASPSVVAQAQPKSAPTTRTKPTPPPTPPLPTSTRAPIPPTTTLAPSTATTTPPPRGAYAPSDPAQPLDPSFSSYFPQTQHNIQHGFRDYWLNSDGLRLLGYPLTEEFEDQGMTVQYFERARLEYRDNKIQWGRLGAELTEGQFFQTVRFFVSDDDNAYFGPTQHSVNGAFLRFWREYGGLSTLGYPISESYKEGKNEYQWFERGRLEWHPNFPEENRIILGQLGREALQKKGWMK